MREAIRERLLSQIPEIQDKERCYDPHMAGAQNKTPYLVLRQGVDVEDTPWTNFRRIIEVWPYLSRASFEQVDILGSKVIAVLDKQLLTTKAGEVFSCVYLGTAGADSVDTEWDVITRGLRFAVMALQPVSAPETAGDDPWLEALSVWTKNLLGDSWLGDSWSVYLNRWPLGYRRPSVLWRLTGIQGAPELRGAVAFEVRKTLVGHVVGTSPNQEVETVLSIAQGLTQAIKIPLDLATRQYMTVEEAKGDYRSDALTRGQINLTLTRIVRRPIRETPVLKEIKGTGNIH